MRRIALATMLLALLATGVPGPAAATGDCVAHVTKLRYRPAITWSCAAPLTTANAVVKRTSNHAVVGADPIAGVGGQTLSLSLHGDLASAATYAVTLSYDDGAGPATLKTTWKTLPPPAHPGLHVKFITAIPADALMDIAHRMDAANLLAVPRPSDFIDAHTSSLSAKAYTAALRGHQSALVVTDLAVQDRFGLDLALAAYCNAGHGVVLGGQTHWLAGANEGWQEPSAVGGQTTRFASKWAMYTYDDVFPNQVTAGAHQLAPGSIEPHFLTRGLSHFTVIGPGSGEPIIQDYSSGHMLARLKPSAGPFSTFGQVFLAERQIGAGRVVDLGFRPWEAVVASGGFDPAVSAGGALTARSLWWATNRIPPTDTHFTTKPANPSDRATVVFAMAAKDADPDGFRDLRFRYRIGSGGRWKWAVGNSFVLYSLAHGSVHTVWAQAVDSGGNLDPHPARYTFRVSANALG